MFSNILHRISKKGKTYSLFRQLLSRPAGMIVSMKIGFGMKHYPFHNGCHNPCSQWSEPLYF